MWQLGDSETRLKKHNRNCSGRRYDLYGSVLIFFIPWQNDIGGHAGHRAMPTPAIEIFI